MISKPHQKIGGLNDIYRCRFVFMIGGGMIGDFGVLGEGAERPSGGRVWEGDRYPRGGGYSDLVPIDGGTCAAEAAKPIPIFKGHFGGKGYLFSQENDVFVYFSDEMGENYKSGGYV